MSTIDLTSPAAALAYLRSLPAAEVIALTGQGEESTVAADAVRAIAGISANDWAAREGRWEWTAAELAEAMAAELIVDEPYVAEIVSISGIHGEAPGSVDVTVRNHGMVRVTLSWEHIDLATHTLTESATARIEAEVKRKGGFDGVEWSV